MCECDKIPWADKQATPGGGWALEPSDDELPEGGRRYTARGPCPGCGFAHEKSRESSVICVNAPIEPGAADRDALFSRPTTGQLPPPRSESVPIEDIPEIPVTCECPTEHLKGKVGCGRFWTVKAAG